MEGFNVKDSQAIINKRSKNLFQQAGLFSKLFFTWIFPLFYKGFRRGLIEEDIFLHLRSHDSKILGNVLEKEWETETKNTISPSLWKVLYRVFGNELLWLGVVNFVWEVVRILIPLFLSKFLDYYNPNNPITKNEAYIYASLVSLTTLAQVMIIHHYMFYILHLGQKIRSATSSLIYRKAVRLSRLALAETTIGQMVNLISNDVARFELCTVNIHSLWLGPIELVVVLVLLYYYVGYSGLPGAGLLLCFIPFQMWLGQKTSLYRLRTAIRTDERIRLMNEIITGMQVIKMYTWEKPFSKVIKAIRKREMEQIKNNLFIRGIIMAFNVFLTRAVIASCILTYVSAGNILNAKYIYVVSLFFEILRQSINQGFTLGVTQFAEASISVRRIKEFLMYDESKNHSNSRDNIVDESDREPVGVVFKNVSVGDLNSPENYVIKNVSFNVAAEELVAVVGKVGSGKSTLLQVILKELSIISGNVSVKGDISYASQESWLFMSSVKQNILFGQEYDRIRYNNVIRVCALEPDLNSFPHGDRTIVSERGISLSGGQKARINLARAVYKRADIYLLDDPLSAVDAQVGRHIFDECIRGFLKNKCVVLVTHQLQYLKACHRIYLVQDGSIYQSDEPSTIGDSDNEFSKFFVDVEREIVENEAVITEEDFSMKADNNGNENEYPKVEKEKKIKGKVTWTVYKSYLLAGGHWCKIFSLLLIFIISQVLTNGTDYFLTIWANVEQLKQQITNNNSFPHEIEEVDKFSIFQEFWLQVLTENTCIITYGSLIIIIVILLTTRALLFFKFCIKASIRLHDGMFDKILHATMKFFNANPSGRILNRFSKDMNQVDEYLPVVLSETLQIGLMGAGITLVIATIAPYMLIPTGIILVIFYFLRVVFIATTRDIKRFEAITRSPVYSHLTASLHGIITIRAFKAQQLLREEFDVLQNAYNAAYFMFLGANRTFGFWLDMHTVAFVTLVIFSFLMWNDERFGGNVGLAITQAITLTGMFQFGIRQWSEMENTMTCVERVKEYADVLPESDVKAEPPLHNWPQQGNIRFDNVSLQYKSSDPYVLKNISFVIESTEKIGIVGRTGAGKSSIITALLRLFDADGKIYIDNIDTKTIPLNILRSSISIIPQDPTLFSGTLRKNLDPFDEYTDEVLWQALEEVKLKQTFTDFAHGLESKMSERGSNLSVGQNQLICLARAIIRKRKILVLDEATANVDPQTDELIQMTIREKFKNCTVLTIAHRLHTIIDSDKVLVMDAGRVVEFGQPYELFQNSNGIFYDLIQQTGKMMVDKFRCMAQNANKTV